jgi:ferrochelatase
VPRGILLVNLGTPASTSIADVRRYLGEFLMDRHVIDVPWPLRRLIVSGFILPFRPRRSARAYAAIWDAAGAGTGSPLLHHSIALRDAIADRVSEPCELGMRYGAPTIREAVDRLRSRGVSRFLLVPLYPHYADSTVGTTIGAVRHALDADEVLDVLPPFYAHPDYIRVQADVIQRHLPATWDHLLLSYHGLPERHLTQADPTGTHCLTREDCCQVASPAHATCYRHQVYRTSELLVARLGLDEQRCSVSFQSRLGRLPWLRPYTDETLGALPGRGVRHLVVACPAFVADNLETLEEIGIAGRETFLSAGGETFTLVPCLNDDPSWIDALISICGNRPSCAA